MRRKLGLFVVAALFMASSVYGAFQESAKNMSELGKPAFMWSKNKDAVSECTANGIIRDDGSFENGLRIPFVSDARFVQLLVPQTFPARLDRVCVCWTSGAGLESMSYNLLAYDDNGNNGQPGTFLGGKQVSAVNLTAFTNEFFGYECSDLNVTVPSGGLYVGVQWNSAAEFHYFLCTDESSSTPASAMYTSSSGGSIWTPVTNNYPDTRALGVRAHFTQVLPPADPPPPSEPALTSSQYPNFRFWVRISDTRSGTTVADCLPETVCVAGAIPTRAEVFVRLVGPKSNGYLWSNIVKFNTTKTEVWIQQISTGAIQYYLLPALPTDSDSLPGVVDKTGFLP
jgi:hypothetical protein